MRHIARRKWMLGAAAAAVGCGNRPRASAANSITVLYPDDEMMLGPGTDATPKFLVFLPLFRWNSRGLENSPYRGDLTWCMDQLWLEEAA